MHITFRFAPTPSPIAVAIDFDGWTWRLDQRRGSRDIAGLDAATLTTRIFDVLVVIAWAGEVTVGEIHDICRFDGKVENTFTTLKRYFGGNELVEVTGSSRDIDAARVRIHPNVSVGFDSVARAKEYVEVLFDHGGGTLPPAKPSCDVAGALYHTDLRSTLERFGYAPRPSNLASIRTALLLITSRRSGDATRLLEVGAAVALQIPIVLVDETAPGGIDLLPLLRDHPAVYECRYDGTAMIATLLGATRPLADPVLRELTAVVVRALGDMREPRPVRTLPPHMQRAPSIREAALRQQRMAFVALSRGRGTRLVWSSIVKYADADYGPHLSRLARQAGGDLANEEDLLRAFCLASADVSASLP